MTTTHRKPEVTVRGARMLRTALGTAIARFLEDPAVVEVMLSPDGRIWVDRLFKGLADTGEMLSSADGERIVRLVAHHVGSEVYARSPRVSAELPDAGERSRACRRPSSHRPLRSGSQRLRAVFTTICLRRIHVPHPACRLRADGGRGSFAAAEAAPLPPCSSRACRDGSREVCGKTNPYRRPASCARK